MKVAPLYHALKKEAWAEPLIVHTGQHYDSGLSDSFFEELRLPAPAIQLGIGSGTHAEQTGKVMIAYEKVLLSERPDLTVVVGDVNSTAACTLAAAKLGVKTAHLEAGLRSFDRSMPEEINRIVTDALADILWTPSPDAGENLLREGVPARRINFVGNIMIDSLEAILPKLDCAGACRRFGVEAGAYCLATFHRPSNVDDPEVLRALCGALIRAAGCLPILLPLHPRSEKNLAAHGLLAALKTAPGMLLHPPLPYGTFMALLTGAAAVLTDSGGIQEETTYLGIPCLTVRDNTERPITVTCGTNRLIKIEQIFDAIRDVRGRPHPVRKAPELWDGRTAGRIVESIERELHAIS